MTAFHLRGSEPVYGHGPVQPPGSPELSGEDAPAAGSAVRAPVAVDLYGPEAGELHIVRGLD
jgi:hypothetical protein